MKGGNLVVTKEIPEITKETSVSDLKVLLEEMLDGGENGTFFFSNLEKYLELTITDTKTPDIRYVKYKVHSHPYNSKNVALSIGIKFSDRNIENICSTLAKILLKTDDTDPVDTNPPPKRAGNMDAWEAAGNTFPVVAADPPRWVAASKPAPGQTLS